MSHVSLAPAPVVAGTRLVRKKRASSFVWVLLALAAIFALVALSGTFPLVVRTATSAIFASRVGRAASDADQFVGRRVSPFVVTIQNNDLHIRGAGTLISDKFVLTSGQNVASLDMLERRVDLITSPSLLSVSIRRKWDEPLQTRRVIRVWLHSAFSSGVGSVKTVNLAILELDAAFEKRPVNAPDYWEAAVLAKTDDLSDERHGRTFWASVFGRIASTREPAHIEGPDYLGEMFGDIVLCGNAEEWLQNNNTVCYATRSHAPPRLCSGDSGTPLSVSGPGGARVVIAVAVAPQRGGCVGDSAPHQWGSAVSVARLRRWIDAVMAGRPFGATEVGLASPQPVQHPCWTNSDPEGEVFCSASSTFRVVGEGAKSDQWRARHCSSGRVVNVPKSSLRRCDDKPCKLQRVCTTEQTLENLEERALQVVCEKGGGKGVYRWNGHTRGFSISNSVQHEVQSCSGGVPEWKFARDLEPCPESACLTAVPVDFESKLDVVCDSLGNAALTTGRKEGSLKQPSVFVPLWFHERIQVVPCHGGPAQWLLTYATTKCLPMEVQRCRGPEGTPRAIAGGVREGPAVFTSTEEEFEKLDFSADRSDF